MSFTPSQLDRLAGLFMDMAKGLYLSSLAIPAFSPNVPFLTILRGMIGGLIFTYLSLKAEELKEVT